MRPIKVWKHLKHRGLHTSQKVSCNRSSRHLESLAAERPELPSWIRLNRNHEELPSDDFIITPFLDWVHSSNRKTSQHAVPLRPQDPNERDINVVCEILMRRHLSSDDVVAELNKANIQASNDLVWQLLKRFRNDLFSAIVIFTWAKSRADSVDIPQMYPFMVDVLGYHRQFHSMWDLVREIIASEGHACLTVISKAWRRLAKARLYNEAMQAFRSIEAFGLPRDITALNILMDAFVKEGSVEHARQAFDEFASTIPPDSSTFNILIHGYCKVRNLDEAKKILQNTKQPDVVSYTSILESYCKMKDFRKAEAVLTEMRERNCKPNVVTYTILMHAYAKAKQMKDAVKVYERIKDERIRPDGGFYSAFIFMLCKMGRIEDAWEIFWDSRSELGFRDLRIYKTMITALCKNSQEERALKVLSRIREESCKPDMSMYVPLLKVSCRMKTMKVFAFLMNHMFKNDVSLDYSGYCLVIDKLSKCGMVNHAAFFYTQMLWKGMIPRRDTCRHICHAVIHGHVDDSATRIDELLRGLHHS